MRCTCTELAELGALAGKVKFGSTVPCRIFYMFSSTGFALNKCQGHRKQLVMVMYIVANNSAIIRNEMNWGSCC
jgi:hypothetical protein